MPDADQTIKTVFIVETQQAIEETKRFRAEVDAVKKQLLDTQQATKENLRIIAEGMKRAAKAKFTDQFGTVDTQKLNAYNKALNTAVTELSGAAKATGAWAKTLGYLKSALAIVGILSFVQVVRKLISSFQDLIKVGEDYAQSIYRLSVSISQLQRRGMDITIKSEIALIKELSKAYSVFTTRGVIEATAAVQMLTRNFAFSQEQIRKTIELSMDLALVQGKDVGETAKMLALFYSSGYGEGLQRAGLAVNRLTVVQEAHRMGLNKSYMALTEQERAAAGYNLVMRQSQDLHQDAMKIQDSLIGQIKEQRSSIEDVTNEIALRALPIELAWLKVKLAFVAAVSEQIGINDAYMDSLRELAEQEGKNFDEMTQKEKGQFIFKRGKDAMKMAREEAKKQREEWEEMLSETLDVSPDINLDLGGEDQQVAEERQKLGEKIMELWNDLQDAKAKFDADMEEAERDHANKIEEINEDLKNKLEDLWKEYQRDLEDIQRDLDRDIVDAQAEYQRDLADLERDTQQAIEDANRKFRDAQLKAERDFQERMQKLREEFLFDLEDALRERDARQVLQLIRRYRLDVEQEQRAFEQRMEELAEEHRQELEEIRRHAEEKRQELLLALQREIEDLQIAAQRKRDDAYENYQQEIAEANEAWRQKREEEDAHYAERQAALEADLAARQEKLLAAFGAEIGMTGTSLETVSELFRAYLGDKGVVDTVINQYLAILSRAAEQTDASVQQMMNALAQLAAAQAIITGVNTSLAVPTWTPSQPGGHAFGGATFATRPTTALFGEAGPELAMFIPQKALSFPNQNMSLPSLAGRGGANNGSARIFIELSPGLIAEVVDNSLGEAAELFTEMMRSR